MRKLVIRDGLTVETDLKPDGNTWIKVTTPHVEIVDTADNFDYVAGNVYCRGARLLFTREQAAEFFKFVDGRLPDNWDEEVTEATYFS
ncbi:hypothetical protein L4D76_27710 [Photobacterium sagamiensis]|uniref:hypothetical protein n=1 Tax=Photobacterium sagamiensis TaxID=2910241 RepID=UPI003D09623B